MGSFAVLERIYNAPSLRVWLLEDHLVTARFPEPELQIWNPSATALWLLLADRALNLDELVFQIKDLFESASPHLEAQLTDCLSSWVQKGWIQLDERRKYIVSPKNIDPTPPICFIDAPKNSKLVFNKIYCINGNHFCLKISLSQDAQSHPFLIRLTSIAQGFLEGSADSKFHLNVVIDAHGIYLEEDSQGYRKYLDSAEALNHCMQYFLKISAGDLTHFLTLHAAGLGLENSLLLSGVSGAGKSTLCALLVQKGWHYYGDDIVGLTVDAEAQGHLVPLPSGVSVKADNWNLLSSHYPVIKTLEVVTYGEKVARYLPLPYSSDGSKNAKSIKGIIFPRYFKNAKTSYHLITAINALTELVKAGISLHNHMSPDAVEWFLLYLCGIPKYHLEYSDINEVNLWLSTLVEN